jgi:four helix bundle protein
MAYQSFEDLEVWKRACRLAVRVYQELGGLTDRSLRDQMQRAAVSIASNIAEGSERGSTKDFLRFLSIAKGSAAELRTQLYIATRIQVQPGDGIQNLVQETREIGAMLQGLRAALGHGIEKASTQASRPVS